MASTSATIKKRDTTLLHIKTSPVKILGFDCGKIVLGFVWESIASFGLYLLIFTLTSTGAVIPDIARIIIGLAYGLFLWMFRASCCNPAILLARLLTLQLRVIPFLLELVATFAGAMLAGLLVFAGENTLCGDNFDVLFFKAIWILALLPQLLAELLRSLHGKRGIGSSS